MTDHDRHRGAEIGVLRDLYGIASPSEREISILSPPPRWGDPPR
jgi:hypothetical protein